MDITSAKNQKIMDIKKLKMKKYRVETGLFIVEGYRNLIDSMKLCIPKEIYCTDDFSVSVSCPIIKVSESVFKEISDTKSPQGILGVFEIPKFDKEKLTDRVLFLNGVSDPGNVGTIFRTALATGFNTIVLDDTCADPFSPKVVRAGMSAVFSINICCVENLDDIIKAHKNNGFSVYASALRDESQNLFCMDLSPKIGLVFGNEANGIDKQLLEIADRTYKIPMENDIESLNVAIASGVSMYEIYRKTNKIDKD